MATRWRRKGVSMETHMETSVIADASSVAKAHTTAQPRPAGSLSRRVHRLLPYLFVLPFVLLFAAFFVAPLIYAFWQSLYKEVRSGLGFGPPKTVWAGAENYVKALHDPQFWDGFGRVLL